MWLAPLQAVVLPISERHVSYARQVIEQLQAAGLRVRLDDRNEKVNLKIREHQLQKTPYMLVVGDREAQNGSVSVRHRKHGDVGARKADDFVRWVQDLVARKVSDDPAPPPVPS